MKKIGFLFVFPLLFLAAALLLSSCGFLGGHEHPLTKLAYREASCTEGGQKECYYCEACDLYFEDSGGSELCESPILAAKGHDEDTRVIKRSTCSEYGLESVSCRRCRLDLGQRQTAKKAHNTEGSRWRIKQKATCQKTGLEVLSCTVCGENVKTTVLPKLSECSGAWQIIEAADCLADGLRRRDCEGCGRLLEEEVIPALGHTPITAEAVPATCLTGGLSEGVHCDACKAILVASEEIPPLGHAPQKDSAVAPTCTAGGKTEGSHCQRCRLVLTAQQTVPATGHTPITDEAIPVSCLADGLTEGSHCDICRKTLVMQRTIPATGHREVTDQALEMTCTTDGLTEGSHCDRCGHVFVAQQVIKAQHAYTYPRYLEKTHTRHCTVCGGSEALPHDHTSGDCICGAHPESRGLLMTLSANQDFYIVSGLGNFTGEHLVIPDTYEDLPVLEIAANAFDLADPADPLYTAPAAERKSIKSITIPRSIERIGENAFRQRQFETVILFDAKKWATLDSSVFIFSASSTHKTELSLGGERITELDLTGIDRVRIYAFAGCATIERLILGDTLIDDHAFSGCTSLQGVTYAGSDIGFYSFSDCPKLESVTLTGRGVVTEKSAFERCHLLSRVDFDAFMHIGDYCFAECYLIDEVSFAEDITHIGEYAFYQCAVKRLVLPDSLSTESSVGIGAFGGNPVTEITLPLNYADTLSGGIGYIFDTHQNPNLTNAAVLLESITYTGPFSCRANAFRGCEKLTSVHFEGGLLGNEIAARAFQNCVSLTEIRLPAGISVIGEEAFSGCSSLTAFLHDTPLISIGARAFYNCTQLATTPSIAPEVALMGDGAFENCQSLTDFFVPSVSINTGMFGSNVLAGCTGLQRLTLRELIFVENANAMSPSVHYHIGYLFGKENPDELSSSQLSKYTQTYAALKEIRIEGGTVYRLSLSYCRGLLSVELGENVTDIELGAFAGSDALSYVLFDDRDTLWEVSRQQESLTLSVSDAEAAAHYLTKREYDDPPGYLDYTWRKQGT